MAKMNKLPDTTVKLIKSGQVVTSVSSVIKELIENSIDAGATNVEIRLLNFGLDLLEVKDNGSGVAPEDLELMVAGHCTSKLKDFEDLTCIQTYGFRGEALHSLCSVAELEITSKRDQDQGAKQIKFDRNGQKIHQTMIASTRGTIIKAVNLFDNLPVRRNYYKKANRQKDDLKRTENLVMAFALIHPGLRIQLSHNKQQLLLKISCTDLVKSAQHCFGMEICSGMELLHHEIDQDTSAHLYVPKKNDLDAIRTLSTRSTNDRTYIFVNNRPVNYKEIDKILRHCFGGKFLFCVISLKVSQQGLDVNLDPNKETVMIEKQQNINNSIEAKLKKYYNLDQPAEVDEDNLEQQQKLEIMDDSVRVVNIGKTTSILETINVSQPLSKGSNLFNGFGDGNTIDPAGSWSKGTLFKNPMTGQAIGTTKMLSKNSDDSIVESPVVNQNRMDISRTSSCSSEESNRINDSQTAPMMKEFFDMKRKQSLITSFSEGLDEDLMPPPKKTPKTHHDKKSKYKINLNESYEQVDVFLERMKPKRRENGEVGDQTLIQMAAPQGAPVLTRCDYHLLRKTIKVEFDWSKMEGGAKKRQVEVIKPPLLSVIGQLRPSGFWIANIYNDLVLLNHHRIQELMIFKRLMQTCALTSTTIAKGSIDIFEQCNWNPDISLTLSSLIQSDGRLSDPRFTLNGLKIKTNNNNHPVLVEICSDINFMGVSDVLEITKAIKDNQDASIEHCRPLKVRSFLKAEAVRMTRQMPPITDLSTITKMLGIITKQKLDVCLHSKPLFHKLIN